MLIFNKGDVLRNEYNDGKRAGEKNELRVAKPSNQIAKYFWYAGYDGYDYLDAVKALNKLKDKPQPFKD